jgi:hypothetical protein
MKALFLVAGYPEELLGALAEELSRRTAPPPSELLHAPPAEPILVAEETDDPAAVRERPRQPADSPALIETYADGVTITLPPTGIWQGSNRFLVVWTCGWCFVLLAITIGFVAGLVTGNLKDEAGQPINPLLAGLFLVPFWLVGLGCLAAVVHRGRRLAILAVAGDRLMILQTGPFRTQQREFQREQLRSLRALVTKHTDSEGSTTWITELLIEPNDGPSVQMLGHRSKQEIEWIATTLRQALRLPEQKRADQF